MYARVCACLNAHVEAREQLFIISLLPPRGSLVLNAGHQAWCRYFYLLSHHACPGPFLHAVVLWKKPPCPENIIPFVGVFRYIPSVCLTSSSLPFPADIVCCIQFIRFCFLAWPPRHCHVLAFSWTLPIMFVCEGLRAVTICCLSLAINYGWQKTILFWLYYFFFTPLLSFLLSSLVTSLLLF